MIAYYMEQAIRKFRRFSVTDIAIFKLLLLSLGVLLGIAFSKPLKKIRPLIWLGTAASTSYLIWRVWFRD